MLKGMLDRFRLGRVERKINKLRVRQRKARRDLKDLEQQNKNGDLPDARYEEKAEKLQQRKSDLTRKIKDLRQRKDELEEALEEA